MKKMYTRFLMTVVLLSVSVIANAYDFEVDGIYYNKLSDNTCEVTYLDVNNGGYTGNITIPSTVNYNNTKYSVVGIGERSCFTCEELNSFTISNTVTSIGAAAFEHCTGLSSFTIPNSVKKIGDSAFEGCINLGKILIPESVESLGDYAFHSCQSLTSIVIPSNVKKIGEGAFAWCYNVKSIKVEEGNESYDSRDDCNAIIESTTNKLMTGCQNTIIPSSVTSFGRYSFCGCTFLKDFVIPVNILSIEYAAFAGCSNLTSITIPSSVTSIENYSFGACSNLSKIEVDKYNLHYDSRENCNAIIETSTNNLISGCKNSTIPNSVKKIETSAFKNCEKLTTVNIPSSVISIGYGAFENCTGLNSVTINKGVTDIEHYAFYGCTNITTVTIPQSVNSIGFYAFHGCSKLSSVTMLFTDPNVIDCGAFYSMSRGSVIHVLPGYKEIFESANTTIDYYDNMWTTIVEDAVLPTSVTTPTTYGNTTNAIFSISGQNLNSLQKGVNIINGKKFLVK